MSTQEQVPAWAQPIIAAIQGARAQNIKDQVERRLADLPKEVYAALALPQSEDQVDAFCATVREKVRVNHKKSIDAVVDDFMGGVQVSPSAQQSTPDTRTNEEKEIDAIVNSINW